MWNNVGVIRKNRKNDETLRREGGKKSKELFVDKNGMVKVIEKIDFGVLKSTRKVKKSENVKTHQKTKENLEKKIWYQKV